MVQVFQLLELPAETQKMETYQALLVTRRALLLHTITNMSESVTSEQQDNLTQFKQVNSVSSEGEGDLCLVQEVSAALTEYEEVCSEAASAGVDLVTKQFTNNWDYIQSCFFALTILTTIGNKQLGRGGYILFLVISPPAAQILGAVCQCFIGAGYGNFAAETFEGRFFCLFFGIIGIPFMLSVLADVGGIFAGILQLAWDKNKTRLLLLARKLHLVSQGSVSFISARAVNGSSRKFLYFRFYQDKRPNCRWTHSCQFCIVSY